MIKKKKDTGLKRLDIKFDFSEEAFIPEDGDDTSLSKDVSSLDEDFNINKLIKKILKSELGVPLDVKIDDSSMPTAPNFVTFWNEAEFMNVKGFARQNEIGTKLMGEYCPRCTDMKWFENVPVNASLRKFKKKVTLLEFGVCPKCGVTRSKLLRTGELKHFEEAAICAGQRSAKSHTTAGISCYVVHRYLKLQNPTQLLGLTQGTMLHGTFVALTYAQARDNLWDPFYAYIQESPWFKKYHKLLRTYNEKYSEEIFKVKDTFLLYRHRSLFFYASGPNQKTLRGRTRVFGAMDELGWFDNNAEKNKIKDNADEVFTAMENSLFTVRGAVNRLVKQGYNNVPTAFFVNVSSPSHARDKIMERVNKSKLSKKIFAMHKPTWEMNPNLTKEDFSDKFLTDPIAAERDFGANPPLADSPLIASIDPVLACCFLSKNKMTSMKYKQHKNKKGDPTRYAIVDFAPVNVPTVLAIDAGFSNNSFACVVASINKTNKYVEFKTFIEIQPKPGVPVNYTLLYKYVLKEIIKKQNVKVVASDRWQNKKILSDLEMEFGVETKQYSVRYNDLTLFKDYILDKEVIFPKYEYKNGDEILNFNYSDYPKCFATSPVSHFMLQCVTVQDTGHTVNKGSGLTDDLFRAAALAFTILQDKYYKKLLLSSTTTTQTVATGVYATKSGGMPRGQLRSQVISSSGKAIGMIGRR